MRRLLDVALAAALFATGLAELWVPLGTGLGSGSRVLATATCAVATGALAFRRVRPVTVALLVCVPTPLLSAFTHVPLVFFGGLLPVIVVTYTLAATRRDARGLVVLLLPLGAIAALEAELPVFRQPGEVAFDLICLAAAAVAGWQLSTREVKVELTESRAAGLERAAVAEERARIARELHDVIAHSVSVIVVQAGAAEQLVDEDPEHVRRALQAIRANGSEALSEMRRMLGILREPGDELGLAPQPSVAALGPLLEQARAAGLDAELSVEGDPRPLPVGLDLTAFRIVQEALTNTRRHADAQHVSIRLRYGPARVEVEVVDDGRGSVGRSEGGHGLIGMRERVALYRGELSLGPAAGGGFRVNASLPTG